MVLVKNKDSFLHASKLAGVDHETCEMLVQHQSVPDGQTAALFQKRSEYPESLGCFV